jgi:hypothetical protein
MAKQTINLGTPNGKNGDIIRDAFQKINENFTEIYGDAPSTPINVPGATPTVIFSTAGGYTGIKLVITVEGRLDGDTALTNHTQVAEATIASVYNGIAEPVISVYGVIYTSPTPLATFTVRRGVGDVIEVVATNSQTLETLHASVHAIKFVSYYG